MIYKECFGIYVFLQIYIINNIFFKESDLFYYNNEDLFISLKNIKKLIKYVLIMLN